MHNRSEENKQEPWLCRKCEERNEGIFDECWKCSSPHPELERAQQFLDEQAQYLELSKQSLELNSQQLELNKKSSEQYELDIENAKKLSSLLEKAGRVLDQLAKKFDLNG